MSDFSIRDGSGKSHYAKVDKDLRLRTSGVNRIEIDQAGLLGKTYNINTGPIVLTDDSASAVFYLKYNGNEILVIQELLIIVGGSTDGTGDNLYQVVKNPTTGTIVDNESAVQTNTNRNFSSSNTLTADIYKGAEGYTLTDGSVFGTTSRSSFSGSVAFDAAVIVLEKGNSIGVKYTPPSGNTSQDVRVALSCYEEGAEIL